MTKLKPLLWLVNRFWENKPQYRTQWVEDLPDDLQKNTIYIIGGRAYPYYAAVTCPRKHCKQIIHLEISGQFRKRWRVTEHEDGSLTLSPSVYVNKLPCRCHYWLRQGRVVWCVIPSLRVPVENRIHTDPPK